MFKLNNKGFAFSTILYGLMLMGIMIIILIMSVMQTNRMNNKKFVENIEKELNRFSLTESNFVKNTTAEGQEYIVPTGEAGWYKIELWGAQGGGFSNDNRGGYGSYTSGIIYLEQNAHLYFYVGSQEDAFNGGGAGAGGGKRGGGATDVRLGSGNWNTSLDTRIMVAAGGGGAGSASGGDGGALAGLKGSGTTPGNGGTQSTGTSGTGGNATGSNSGGGGGGYRGGSGSTGDGGGGGGSSYISGYAGVMTNGTNKTFYDAGGVSYVFINGFMLEGVKAGDGAARITKVSSGDKDNPPTVLNTTLYNSSVRYVRDCITGSKTGNTSTINNNKWGELQVIVNGANVAAGRPFVYSTGNWSGSGSVTDLVDGKIETAVSNGSNSNQCVIVQLSTTYTHVSEIDVWHDFTTPNQNTINHRVSVSANGTSWTDITSSVSGSLESYETSNGFHYSAWQPDSTSGTLYDGTYYIMSAAGDKTAVRNLGVAQDAKFMNFDGSSDQKWYIKLSAAGYLITTSEGGLPLQVLNGTFYDNSSIGVNTLTGLYDWNQWYLEPAGNGTFYLYALITDQYGVQKRTYLTNGSTTDYSSGNFYNRQNTLYGRTLINSSTDAASNRLMRVRIISATY